MASPSKVAKRQAEQANRTPLARGPKRSITPASDLLPRIPHLPPKPRDAVVALGKAVYCEGHPCSPLRATILRVPGGEDVAIKRILDPQVWRDAALPSSVVFEQGQVFRTFARHMVATKQSKQREEYSSYYRTPAWSEVEPATLHPVSHVHRRKAPASPLTAREA